jgi:hypothetical protein
MHAEDRIRTSAVILAATAGVAWIVDVAVITAINDSFDPLDSILFLGGLGCLLATAGLVGVLASRRFGGLRRVLVAVGVALGLVVGLMLISLAADATSHALYHGGNRGLHKECGVFGIGLVALLISALLCWPPSVVRRGSRLRVRY